MTSAPLRPLLPALAGLVLLQGGAAAQFTSLRRTDSRTMTPESVMGRRSDWGTDLSFGGTFTRGNTDTNNLNGGFAVFKAWDRTSLYLSGSSIYGTSGGATRLNQGASTLRWDRLVAGPWKVFAFDTNAYNEFIHLHYRSTAGLGPWYDWTLGSTRHGLSVAAVYEYEHYRGGVYNHDARVSLREISKIPLSDAAELHADVFYIPRLDDWGDARFYAQLDLETLFWKPYLGLKLSWIDEYQSRPQPGIKRNDTLWLTSLTCHLGR